LQLDAGAVFEELTSAGVQLKCAEPKSRLPHGRHL
jgi:hypothetical protein